MRVRAIFLAAVIALVPLGGRAADLVVWWEKGFYPEEDRAVTELVAAFEHKLGKDVQLVLQPQEGIPTEVEAALAAGRPPDLLRAAEIGMRPERWAAAGALVDLSDVVLPLRSRFFPGLLDYTMLRNSRTGSPTLFTAPLGQPGTYLHIWTSLLERAGFSLDDIPKEWEAFWSFWCDQVQPAVREVTGRDDVWGLGLSLSAASDTSDAFTQFMLARSAYFWPISGQSLVEDRTFRPNLIEALVDYTEPWRKGCVPPEAVDWDNRGNNKAFLDQHVLLVINASMSIPAALRASRPEDYYEATATIDWPVGPDGRTYPLLFSFTEAVVFASAQNIVGAKQFLRFILEGDRLDTWLERAQGRFMPTMPELAGKQFWMDPVDPHRRTAVEQLFGPTMPVSGPARASLPRWWDQDVRQQLFGKLVRRVAVDGLTPAQAADGLIARLEQLRSR
jgi:multiple sugar transport system substrate-binding protein